MKMAHHHIAYSEQHSESAYRHSPECMCGIMLQADYALSRLVALKERTEATESLAKMHLAQRRNELVSFDLMMSVISINIGFFGAVAAVCGMNLWLAGSKAPKVCRPLPRDCIVRGTPKNNCMSRLKYFVSACSISPTLLRVIHSVKDLCVAHGDLLPFCFKSKQVTSALLGWCSIKLLDRVDTSRLLCILHAWEFEYHLTNQ